MDRSGVLLKRPHIKPFQCSRGRRRSDCSMRVGRGPLNGSVRSITQGMSFMYRFRVSLKSFMLTISIAAILVAVAASSWRAATRPDISFGIVLHFSETYSPPALNSNDIAETMYQMVPNARESNRTSVDSTLVNARAQVLPYGENAIQIVASGKSWQIEPASIELLARATAQLITRDAHALQVTANVTSETSSRGRSLVPKSILAEYDRSKR